MNKWIAIHKTEPQHRTVFIVYAKTEERAKETLQERLPMLPDCTKHYFILPWASAEQLEIYD